MNGTTAADAAPQRALAAGPIHASSPLVLYVEDEPLLREVIARVLERLGVEVVTASCGREALELLEVAGLRPALIVTDVDMPGMSGEELLRAVRRDPRLAAIPVVAASGLDTQEDFDLVVLKPFGVEDLRRMLAACLPGGAGAAAQPQRQ